MRTRGLEAFCWRRTAAAAVLFLVACDAEPPREATQPENLKPAARRALADLNLADRKAVQAALESAGYALVSGKWQEKAPWKAALDNLHHTDDLAADQEKIASSNPALKWKFSRLVLKSEIPRPTPPERSWEEKRERFFSTKGSSGSLTIDVEAPAPFYECSIVARGAVRDNERKGSIKVTLTPEGGQPFEIYSIVESGDKDSHDVTKEMKGKTRCRVTVEMQNAPDQFHDYARFLPCLPESKDVFVVGGCFLKPAPELDKIWEKAK